MKTRSLTLFMLLATLLLTTGCNYREYCNEFSYEERARIKYIWDEAKAPVIPPLLNIEFGTDTRASVTIYESANDYYELSLPYGTYNPFAWNPTENIEVEDRTFYADTYPDGTLKSVGELYSGETDFELRSPDVLENEAEKGNTHVWNSKPYHDDGENLIFYKEVPLIMKPQTREIRIVLEITDESIDYIETMKGMLEGICQSKDANGNYLNGGNIRLEFTKVGNTMIATYRVLGCMPDLPQNLDLDITFNDGSKSDSIRINITEGLKTFNDDLGGARVDIPVKISLKKEENEFTVKILDWEDVTSGDNDLEAE